MNSPSVSVICLCHNHKDYVAESIQSVLSQSYTNVELILVDDGSTDESKEVISNELRGKNIPFIAIEKSIGNCKAFNEGFKIATGDYIIDLAADDLLLPKRIEEGMKTFLKKDIGVEFCNVLNIDKDGNELNIHFESDKIVSEGDVYKKLITTYFISPPGMMVKKAVLEDLGGYDETLSYEDFDFWIRSSRNHRYGYSDHVLIKKRNAPDSLSKKQFQFLSIHQQSTLKVCRKIKELNRSKEEDIALRKRCFYEIKNCIKQGNIHLIPAFLKLCF